MLGIKAVLAQSFERIHRSNLVNMGILPLCLPPGMAPGDLALQVSDAVVIDARPERLTPRGDIPVAVRRSDGTELTFTATAAVETRLEVEVLAAGGVIPLMLRARLEGQTPR